MKYIFYLLLFTLIHCFSELRPPPITFTQTQTAAEKQMIGEDRELEKDGWLISSIKTSSSGTEDWKKEDLVEESNSMEAKEILSLQRGLAYTAPEVKTLKIYGILGEGLDGLLHRIQMNPKLEKERYSNPESQKRINDLIQIVNQYRSSLRKIILTNQKKKLKEEDFSEYQKMLQLEYYNSVESGEYFERGKGKWEKKE